MKIIIIITVLLPFIEGCFNALNCPGGDMSFEKINPNTSLQINVTDTISTIFIYKKFMNDSTQVDFFTDSNLQSKSYLVEFEIEGETWEESRIAYSRHESIQDTLHLWITPYDNDDTKPKFLRFRACSLVESYVKLLSVKIYHSPMQNIEYVMKDYYSF